jgi:hypothetical protein
LDDEDIVPSDYKIRDLHITDLDNFAVFGEEAIYDNSI